MKFQAASRIIQRLDHQESFVAAIPPRLTAADSGDSGVRPGVLMPGSFNPIHQGHRRMAAIAQTRLAAPVWLELSLENVDKRSLTLAELDRRLKQSFQPAGLIVTRACRFVDKAGLFPGATFVVGADTIERVSDPRYYGSVAERDRAIAKLTGAGSRFLVFGRRLAGRGQVTCSPADVAAGDFRGANVRIEPDVRQICEFVSRAEFDQPISSRQLRNDAASGFRR